MRLFAIGDVQGCQSQLKLLLETIGFDPLRDHVWFTGDLVNRGPESLAVLRFVRDLGSHATTVLGNHDLHLLAVASGAAQIRKRDTFTDVLEAPDRDELLDWLRSLPLAVYRHDVLMVHAGLAPQWDVRKAVALSDEIQLQLESENYTELLANMYGNKPARWDDALTGIDRLRCIINFLTRARYTDNEGVLQLHAKGSPGSQPPGQVPWFRVPGRASAEIPVVFGHWSTLGRVPDRNVVPLDSGCVWGGSLTAIRLLPRGRRTAIRCQGFQKPG